MHKCASLLYILDTPYHKEHSFIDDCVKAELSEYYNIYLVYFSKQIEHAESNAQSICIPYDQRLNVVHILQDHFPRISRWDIALVRNRVDILSAIISHREHLQNPIVCFQLSFPHQYQRLYSAKTTLKKIRCTIEYKIKRQHLVSLLNNHCDIFFPISADLASTFYPDVSIETLPLPIGLSPRVEYYQMSQMSTHSASAIRIAYIGSINEDREFELTLDAVNQAAQHINIEFFIATRDVECINRLDIKYPKIHFDINPFMPRTRLRQCLAHCDIGLAIIPPTELFTVSTPIKTMDYYAAGIPAIVTPLPEFTRLFEPTKSAFFTEFNADEVCNQILASSRLSRRDRNTMAQAGLNAILKQRNYKTIARELHELFSYRLRTKGN